MKVNKETVQMIALGLGIIVAGLVIANGIAYLIAEDDKEIVGASILKEELKERCDIDLNIYKPVSVDPKDVTVDKIGEMIENGEIKRIS